jgi:hypothetical protein
MVELLEVREELSERARAQTQTLPPWKARSLQ